MPHSPKEKKAVLTRVRKLKGQLLALESALEDEVECSAVLQQIAAIRGAVNGLMAGGFREPSTRRITGVCNYAEPKRVS